MTPLHDPQTVANQRAVDVLVNKLRRRQLVGSRAAALETLLVLRQVLSKAIVTDIDQLVNIIKAIGRRLVEAQPNEHAVGNTVRKLLHVTREEERILLKSSSPTNTIQNFSISKFVLLGQPRKQQVEVRALRERMAEEGRSEDDSDDERKPGKEKEFGPVMKTALMEAIKYMIDELETVYDNISKNAKDHIHSDEIILTLGMSKTVETFLISAARDRKYTVIVAETAPSYGGRDMAKSLASAGISTFLVPDSSIYALMSRVNKVILGAHAILADGGVFAITGSLMAATAARAHRTPIVVCTGLFKLTPAWNLYHEYGALDFGDPSKVLEFEEGDLVDRVDVVNPNYDYVRPELVDAFITNDGDHPPSSVYRLIKETYDDEDNVL
ncbi:hypothetical protein AX16_008829 [Volvariella volvacea WC 439]|nr:hypothetical protein AX16_008829 [Volvariella volvacea WC 439]